MLRCPTMRHQSHTANLTETTLVNAFLKVTAFLFSYRTRLLYSLFNLRQRWLDQYSILNSCSIGSSRSSPGQLSCALVFTIPRLYHSQNCLRLSSKIIFHVSYAWNPAILGSLLQPPTICLFVTLFCPLTRLLVNLHVRPLVLLGTTRLSCLYYLGLAPKPLVKAVARYTLQPKLRLPHLSYSQFLLSQYRVEHNTGSCPYGCYAPAKRCGVT